MGIARRRRENFGILGFRIQSKTVIFSGFGVLFECISKGFPTISATKNPENFSPPATGQQSPLNSKSDLITGGILKWGGFLSGIALMDLIP